MSRQFQQQGNYDDYDSDTDDEAIQSSEQFKDRHDSCTDLPCCCLWIACLVAFMFVMGYGFANGNPKRLHHGIDHLGRVCGVDLGVELLPYTYFCPPTSWVAGALSTTGFVLTNPVCVAACPIGNNVTADAVFPATITECEPLFGAKAYKTVASLNYCMPDGALHMAAQQAVGGAISGYVPTLMKAADSISKGWPVYLITFFLAMFLGYAYLCCLKTFAKIMVWLAIIVAFCALALTGGYMVHQAPTVGTNEIMQANFGGFATTMAYATGFACLGGAFAILCLVCCCAGQVEMAVVAVQMTTDVMANIPSLLFAPLVKAVIKFIVAMVLLGGFVYLLSCAKPTAVVGSAMLRQFEYKEDEKFMIIFYVFMYGWIMAFLTAVYQFAIAYATADYFYATVLDYEGEREVGCCNMLEGLCVGLFWHQGSFAFGSFVIAIFSLIQRCIEYIEKSNRDPSGVTKNPCVTIITCCCMCCVTMCKSCAEFINKNAYIGIAIKGYSFCQACRKAFKIMIENAAGMAILNGATYVFQIAGLLLITACTMLISDAICGLSTFTDPASDWFLPHPPVVVLVCGIIGFIIAKLFMDVFDMVSDTLMYCFGLEGFNTGSNKVPQPLRQAVEQAGQLQREGK